MAELRVVEEEAMELVEVVILADGTAKLLMLNEVGKEAPRLLRFMAEEEGESMGKGCGCELCALSTGWRFW
jgi:hypothetical protein